MYEQTLIATQPLIDLYTLQYEDPLRFDEIMAEAMDYDEDNNEN